MREPAVPKRVPWYRPVFLPRGARFGLVDDLLESRLLVGRTRSEVVELLGPDAGGDDAGDLLYELGPERGFLGIDSEWLSIRFGPTRRVVRARIVTD